MAEWGGTLFDWKQTVNVRALNFDELPDLLRLYAVLNPDDPVLDPDSSSVKQHWQSIFDHPLLRYYGVEEGGRIVSTCTLSIVPNLSRNLQSYGVVENVVTAPEFRGRGYATAVLDLALSEAWGAGCYKVMVQTGSKDPATLRFYEKAGFKPRIKTAFVAYLPGFEAAPRRSPVQPA